MYELNLIFIYLYWFASVNPAKRSPDYGMKKINKKSTYICANII